MNGEGIGKIFQERDRVLFLWYDIMVSQLRVNKGTSYHLVPR